ncbi:uncharacterized protein LOC131929624 [Physella acuta]|uniref:uncharacterized protein LOC131929624 n=1 Tax=Physella acuta TaxID=109671 RepID=UPI0027DB035E|nr:uncharacterized protein LOC131929624 [Physella acuta]
MASASVVKSPSIHKSRSRTKRLTSINRQDASKSGATSSRSQVQETRFPEDKINLPSVDDPSYRYNPEGACADRLAEHLGDTIMSTINDTFFSPNTELGYTTQPCAYKPQTSPVMASVDNTKFPSEDYKRGNSYTPPYDLVIDPSIFLFEFNESHVTEKKDHPADRGATRVKPTMNSRTHGAADDTKRKPESTKRNHESTKRIPESTERYADFTWRSPAFCESLTSCSDVHHTRITEFYPSSKSRHIRYSRAPFMASFSHISIGKSPTDIDISRNSTSSPTETCGQASRQHKAKHQEPQMDRPVRAQDTTSFNNTLSTIPETFPSLLETIAEVMHPDTSDNVYDTSIKAADKPHERKCPDQSQDSKLSVPRANYKIESRESLSRFTRSSSNILECVDLRNQQPNGQVSEEDVKERAATQLPDISLVYVDEDTPNKVASRLSSVKPTTISDAVWTSSATDDVKSQASYIFKALSNDGCSLMKTASKEDAKKSGAATKNVTEKEETCHDKPTYLNIPNAYPIFRSCSRKSYAESLKSLQSLKENMLERTNTVSYIAHSPPLLERKITSFDEGTSVDCQLPNECKVLSNVDPSVESLTMISLTSSYPYDPTERRVALYEKSCDVGELCLSGTSSSCSENNEQVEMYSYRADKSPGSPPDENYWSSKPRYRRHSTCSVLRGYSNNKLGNLLANSRKYRTQHANEMNQILAVPESRAIKSASCPFRPITYPELGVQGREQSRIERLLRILAGHSGWYPNVISWLHTLFTSLSRVTLVSNSDDHQMTTGPPQCVGPKLKITEPRAASDNFELSARLTNNTFESFAIQSVHSKQKRASQRSSLLSFTGSTLRLAELPAPPVELTKCLVCPEDDNDGTAPCKLRMWEPERSPAKLNEKTPPFMKARSASSLKTSESSNSVRRRLSPRHTQEKPPKNHQPVRQENTVVPTNSPKSYRVRSSQRRREEALEFASTSYSIISLVDSRDAVSTRVVTSFNSDGRARRSNSNLTSPSTHRFSDNRSSPRFKTNVSTTPSKDRASDSTTSLRNSASTRRPPTIAEAVIEEDAQAGCSRHDVVSENNEGQLVSGATAESIPCVVFPNDSYGDDGVLNMFLPDALSRALNLAGTTLLSQMENIKEKNSSMKVQFPQKRGFYEPPKAYPIWLHPEHIQKLLRLLGSTEPPPPPSDESQAPSVTKEDSICSHESKEEELSCPQQTVSEPAPAPEPVYIPRTVDNFRELRLCYPPIPLPQTFKTKYKPKSSGLKRICKQKSNRSAKNRSQTEAFSHSPPLRPGSFFGMCRSSLGSQNSIQSPPISHQMRKPPSCSPRVGRVPSCPSPEPRPKKQDVWADSELRRKSCMLSEKGDRYYMNKLFRKKLTAKNLIKDVKKGTGTKHVGGQKEVVISLKDSQDQSSKTSVTKVEENQSKNKTPVSRSQAMPKHQHSGHTCSPEQTSSKAKNDSLRFSEKSGADSNPTDDSTHSDEPRLWGNVCPLLTCPCGTNTHVRCNCPNNFNLHRQKTYPTSTIKNEQFTEVRKMPVSASLRYPDLYPLKSKLRIERTISSANRMIPYLNDSVRSSRFSRRVYPGSFEYSSPTFRSTLTSYRHAGYSPYTWRNTNFSKNVDNYLHSSSLHNNDYISRIGGSGDYSSNHYSTTPSSLGYNARTSINRMLAARCVDTRHTFPSTGSGSGLPLCCAMVKRENGEELSYKLPERDPVHDAFVYDYSRDPGANQHLVTSWLLT